MNNNIEYFFINPELKEIENIINNTLKHYLKKYGNSYWKRFKIYIIFVFLIKQRTKKKILQTNEV